MDSNRIDILNKFHHLRSPHDWQVQSLPLADLLKNQNRSDCCKIFPNQTKIYSKSMLSKWKHNLHITVKYKVLYSGFSNSIRITGLSASQRKLIVFSYRVAVNDSWLYVVNVLSLTSSCKFNTMIAHENGFLFNQKFVRMVYIVLA